MPKMISHPTLRKGGRSAKGARLWIIRGAFVLIGVAVLIKYLHPRQPTFTPRTSSSAASSQQRQLSDSIGGYPRIRHSYRLLAGYILCRQEQGVVDFEIALRRKDKAAERRAIQRYGCAPTERVNAGAPVVFLTQTGIVHPLAEVRLSNKTSAWVDVAALQVGRLTH